MKKIAIYCFTYVKDYVWDEEGYINGSVGGSEAWAIKLSDELVNRGYDVYIFANPKEEHDSKNGVHYLSNLSFEKYCNEQTFDYIIMSRTVEAIKYVKNCNNIYLMCHDVEIGGFYNGCLNDVKKVMYQSDFQHEILRTKYSIPDNKFYRTFECIEQDLYDKYDGIEKTNKMLFSSGFGRGIRWIAENVFPKIKKEVPDFELHISGYNDGDIMIQSFKQDGIFVHGKLNRDDYLKMQCSSKIWIYPSHGYDSEFNRNNETFSICCAENAYAKNACILGRWGCFASTLEGYNGFVGDDLFNGIIEPMDYDNLEKFADELANDAIKCLKNEDYRLSKVASSYEISKKYSVNALCDNIEKMFLGENEKELKVLLCCIGRLENRYIREYVEYNKNIGFTNICLYDNNRDGEEDFHDVIGDYIDSGYVILKDYRNITIPCQFMAYNECYEDYGKEYDWIAFLDIDEFVFLNVNKNIKEYLSNSIFDNFDMIHLNWLMFGDGDMAYDNGLPLLARIKTPLDVNLSTGYNIPDTFHVKSIIRGGLESVVFSQTPHTPTNELRCCNSFGIGCQSNSPFTPYDFRNGGILHFTTKTAEEFSEKVKRGFCDGNPKTQKELVELFFKRNKVTKEKVDIIKEKTGIDVSYLLPYDGEKNNDVKIFSLCYQRKNFKFLDDAVVTPLQVGSANNQNVCDLKDNTGDNISMDNYFFIESTGTYWIWKNVHDVKYKGQMQYRRPLDGVNETMDFDDVFSKYDVITCKPFNHPENSKPTEEQPMCIPAQTVEEGYKFSNCIDDLYILELAIKHYHPDYAQDYDKYIKKGENLYYSNGFIMRTEDFDRYSEFLFDCLSHYLELANIKSFDDLLDHVRYNLETGKYIRYEKEPVTDAAVKWQTEIGGFLSERIWTLWLQHNFSHDRIYELPYIKMEDNMYT